MAVISGFTPHVQDSWLRCVFFMSRSQDDCVEDPERTRLREWGIVELGDMLTDPVALKSRIWAVVLEDRNS
ncbi:MAG: hypothetical protein ABL962_15035 [Fimbriimonadaceae bacterium]